MKISESAHAGSTKIVASNHTPKPNPMSDVDVRALTSRLRRAEGQVRAVARRIEEGEDCGAVQQGQVAPEQVADLLAKYA